MDLSVNMAKTLREWVAHPELREQNVRPGRWGSRWYCPACGVPTVNVDGSVRCPRCNGSLDGFVYELVEFNPHLRI
jgi:rubrerythrin